MQVLKITTTGLARTGKTFVNGITLVAGGAAATVTLNDSLDDSGDDKGGVKAVANTSQDSNLHGNDFVTGVYATITGANAVAYVYIA